MPERIRDDCLAFAVLPVMGRVGQLGSEGDRTVDHRRDVGNLEHHLMRSQLLWRPSSGSDLGHYQLGRWRVGEAELRTVTFADADVLDESEDVRVPPHGRPHVDHGEHGGDTGVRR